jgi:hypothetical protein
MATTSIWKVEGWLGKVVNYAQNPSKTENPAFSGQAPVGDIKVDGLDDVIDYVTQDYKTEKQYFVSGVNCFPLSARDEMLSTKREFRKEGGIIAFHGYQSFAPGETTPEQAHEIGVALAKKLWGERFEVLISTHLDRGHIHNHLIINSVSFVDGKRFHRSKKVYQDMRDTSDELCAKNDLSVIKKPVAGHSKQYGEWRAEREGRPTWRSLIKVDVDESITKAMTDRQFFDNLKALGYEIKIGADISVRPPGKERFFRLARNFGDSYTRDAIFGRILNNTVPVLPVMKTSPSIQHTKMPQFLKGGLRGLYQHYCYLFGFYKHEHPNTRMPFELREDLRKLDTITREEEMISREKIETLDGLFIFKDKLLNQIDELAALRKKLNTLKKKTTNSTDIEKTTSQINRINDTLKTLRREVRYCDDIAQRSGIIAAKVERIETAPTRHSKEVKQSGRNRTSNRTGHAHDDSRH